MKRNLIYFYLQLKTLLLHLPAILAGTIVLALFAGTIAFCGTKLLYQNDTAGKITIALVIEDESDLMQLGLKYLESSESINTFCKLDIVSHEEAEQMLADRRAAACIYFPESFSDDIVSGKNTPAVITFSSKTGLEQLLFQELAQAAASILGSAQASIYTIHDLYDTYSFQTRKGIHYDYVNQHTLETAFIRSNLFEVHDTDSTQGGTVLSFYTASGIVLMLLFSGMTCGYFIIPENRTLSALLTRYRLSPCCRLLWKLLALTVFYTVLFALMLCVGIATGAVPASLFVYLPVLSLFCSSHVLVFYTFARSRLGGALLTFVISMAGILCAGALVPASFLPVWLAQAGQQLPSACAHQLILKVLRSKPDMQEVLPLITASFILYLLALLPAHISERRTPHEYTA